MITIGGKEYRNLVEQVQKNKDDIANYHNFNEALADWGIKIIGRLDVWSPPQGEFEYGDAYAVGPEGGPFVFYIWTRGTPDYWFDYGAISIVGPQGPQGEPGERGADGKSSRWYVSSSAPTSNLREGDMWLRADNDGATNGFVYIYQNNNWALTTSIKGPTGNQGPEGKQGPQGPRGPAGPQGPRGFTTITNIIGELPEGSIISETYDPSSQPDNATVLMPVGGVQHAWVIINGVWTDAGPYSGGSTVYVGGQAVNSFDADTKLNISTERTYNRVYSVTDGGVQQMVKLSGVREAYAIPRYDANGRLQATSPVNAFEVANKSYVDERIEKRIWALHDYQQHGNFSWTGNQEFDFTIGIGQIAENVILNYGGDFTAWGGGLVFYGIGGLVMSAEGMGYTDNDGIIHRLICRMDTGTAELQCLYSTGQTWANATSLATFDIGFVEMATNQTYTVTLGMVRSSGLYGGLFPLDAIPDPR